MMGKTHFDESEDDSGDEEGEDGSMDSYICGATETNSVFSPVLSEKGENS